MANVKISQLPSATTPLAGTEVLPIVQGTTTKKVTVANLRGTAVTAVTGTAPVVSSGGTTPAISMPAATGLVNGYLTSADWTTFNGKQPAGSYLVSGGALGTPSSGTATNLTGLPLTTGVTGILQQANGGTGTATPSLVAGTNVSITGTWPNQTINSSGGGGGGMVYPGAGIPLSTGTAWGTSYNSTGTGDVVLSTSPTLVTPLLGTPTSGNFSTGTFTWPTFNQNTTGTAANVTASSNSTLTTLSALSLPGSQVSGNISGNAANVTGVVAFANGGTGEITRQAAMDALAGAVTSGSYLRGNGTDVVMATIQAADVPTLNQNTTGTAANVTGVVGFANGGTGLSTTPVNGALDIGNGAGFTRTTLTAGANITITNASGSITIASTGGGGTTSIGLVRAVAINCILP